MKATVKSLLTLVALAAMPVVLHAQNPQPSTPGGNSERRDGERRQFNFEDFRKRMNEQMKTSLKVNDEEWGVLQPLIEKVTEKQRETSTRSFGGFGGDRRSSSGGNNSGGDSSRPERAGTAERDALRTTLQNEGASTEEIKAKLAALRETRKKSSAELATAREELKKVVTVRQEAVLVSMGILE